MPDRDPRLHHRAEHPQGEHDAEAAGEPPGERAIAAEARDDREVDRGAHERSQERPRAGHARRISSAGRGGDIAATLGSIDRIRIHFYDSCVRALAALALALALVVPAHAESPLVSELRTWATRYHEDPPHLDALRTAIAQSVKTDPQLETLVAFAQVSFLWGDIRAKTPDEKLQAYDQGRQAAKRAIDLAPGNAAAHFWYGTTTALWGQTRGVIRSLFLLPTVKQEINTVLALDPSFAPVYSLAGNVYYEVPGPLGGDLDKAEQMFRKGLALEPRFTGMRIGLAKTLIRKGRIGEARKELQAVIEEKAPLNPATWTMRDSVRARELLESTKGRS